MWSKHRKIWVISFAVLINTMLLVLLIGYYKKNVLIDTTQNVEEGEQVNITEIYTVEDYFAFAESINKDNIYNSFTVTLYADLDFSEYDDVPIIGIVENEEASVEFKGTFEGNGHMISGIHMSNPDGIAAMFAKLTGTVKNLRVENCSFEGAVCGAIAAENSGGAVLNCYVEAQVAGDVCGVIAGKNYGEISNCVASAECVGENTSGENSHCYIIGKEDIAALNYNLHDISARYADTTFFRWENGGLSSEKIELLESLTARLIVGGQEVKINGYYSTADEQWCFALPANYGDEELYIEAVTSNGQVIKSLERNYAEESVEFSWKDVSYKISFLSADDVDTLYITLSKDLDYVHTHKKEEVTGKMLIIDEEGTASNATIKGFYGHGNDSWKAEKKSYNLKFDSDVDLLDMGANEDYVLLAGYRENSLMSYCISGEMTQALGFSYAPEFRLVNLYINGEYVGVYYLTERIELDTNRIAISSVYEETKKINNLSRNNLEQQVWANGELDQIRYYYNVPNDPADITGGYLLERDFDDYSDADSRFTTTGKTSRMILKRATYSSEAQVAYISDFWQDFEFALFSENGYNEEGKHYTEYIDMESFVMQWLMYELSMESSIRSSVYYYKESDISGDGLIHALYPWDVERSFVMKDTLNEFGSVSGQGEYWAAFYQHKDFREEAYKVWKEKFVPVIDLMLEETVTAENGVKNLSWYEENIADVSRLENSRWEECDMLSKCDMIRTILTARKEVLSNELSDYGEVQ